MKEFDKRSKHFPFGDHFNCSQNLFSWLCIDVVGRKFFLSLLGLKWLIHIIFIQNISPILILAKSTRIIHHNQLLNQIWKNFVFNEEMTSKCSLLQVNAPLPEKTWGRAWVVFVVKTKMACVHNVRWNTIPVCYVAIEKWKFKIMVPKRFRLYINVKKHMRIYVTVSENNLVPLR